jgi:hypothetical protein
MKVTVLKAFPYAHDGIRTEMLAAGPDREVRDELVSGLQAAGLIAAPRDDAALPGLPLAGAELGALENAALGPAPENNLAEPTDTVSQRDKRKRA